MKQLCVLLSTYNGEKYVIEQLESIFSQEVDECHIKVLIRDDGSKDNTVRICWNYAEQHRYDIEIIEGDNVRPAKSFLKLIDICPKADYYAFCDQDDIWLPGKVAAAISRLDDEVPQLWFSNYDVVDVDLAVMQTSAIREPELNPLRIIFYNNVPGCTMVFNWGLMAILKSFKMTDIRMHDIFALSTASALGQVAYDPDSYILYRQHTDNVLGYGNKKFNIALSLKGKIDWIVKPEDYHMTEYAQKLLDLFENKLDSQVKEGMTEISKYKDRFTNTIRLLRKPYTKDQIGRTAISIRCKILLRMF